jgi:hypothetical protein
VTPNKNELQWGLDADAEFRSPSEAKTVALSVRRSIATGSIKRRSWVKNKRPIQRRATSLS